MVDEKVTGADRRELLRCGFDRVPRRAGDRNPLVGLQVGAIEEPELAEIREVDHAVERIDEIAGDAEPGLELLAHCTRHRVRHFEARDFAEAHAPKLELDSFEEIVRLIRDVEIRVACHTEERCLEYLHAGEQARQVMAQHLLERKETAARPDGEEPRQALGHLDAGEPHLAAVRILDEQREADRERRDVRERLPRPDGERCEDRIDLALEPLVEENSLLVVQLLDSAYDDSFVGQSRTEHVGPDLRLPLVELDHLRPRLGERLRRRPTVGRTGVDPGGRLPREPGDSDHEELVEHLRKDLQEEDAVE